MFFLILNIVYVGFAFFTHTPNTAFIGSMMCGMLTLSMFASLSSKNVITNRFLLFCSILFLVASVMVYNFGDAMLRKELEMDESDDITNNSSALFLFLLPLIFYIRNNIVKFGVLGVCIFFILMGAKRGTILAAAVPIIVLVWAFLKENRRSFGRMIIVLIGIAVLAGVSYYWYSTNEYLLYRVDQTMEGDSSNRDRIYSTAWNTWLQADSLLNTLFGFGYNAMNKINKVSAHSDWLEILVDNGLLGVILYLSIFIQFVQLINHSTNKQAKMVLIAAVSIWFMKSIYSMAYIEGSMVMLMIPLGSAVGQYRSVVDEENRCYE